MKRTFLCILLALCLCLCLVLVSCDDGSGDLPPVDDSGDTPGGDNGGEDVVEDDTGKKGQIHITPDSGGDVSMSVPDGAVTGDSNRH